MEDQSRVTRVWGRHLQSSTEQTGTVVGGSLGLNPQSLDARLADMADDWLQFRFTKVQARILVENPNSAETAAGFVWLPIIVTYEPIATGLTAPVKADLEHFPCVAIGSPYQLPCLELGRKELLGMSPVKWFQTDTGATDISLEQQGTINWDWVVGTGGSSGDLLCLIEYECEFRSPCDPNIVGERRAKKWLKEHPQTLVVDEGAATPASNTTVPEEHPPPTVRGPQLAGTRSRRGA